MYERMLMSIRPDGGLRHREASPWTPWKTAGGGASRKPSWLGWVLGGLWLVGGPIAVANAEVAVDPALPAEMAATVNGQPVPRHLVEVFLKNDHEALELDPKTDYGRKALAELPGNILDELIDRTLIAQAVKALGVAPTEETIRHDESNLIAFCGSDARYDAYVAQNGFTRDEYREVILRTAANGKAMIAKLTGELEVPASEIAAYYQAHKVEADFQWPERVRGEHILVNAQPGVIASGLEQSRGLQPDTSEMRAAVDQETTHREQLAEWVLDQLTRHGADLSAMAVEYSDDAGSRHAGGSLLTFAKGVHPPALDDAFFACPPGGYGPVVRTEYGFHVIHVSAHLPAGGRTLEEATPEIRRRLMQEKAAKTLRAWLAQERIKAKIVIRKVDDLPMR